MPHKKIMEERLRLLNIDRDVISELRKAKDILKPAMDEMLDNFYAYIRSEPDLKALFTDQGAMTRARSAQKNHWLTLLDGKYDGEYFEKTVRIGQAHARIGLTLDWYIAGYYQMFDQFIGLIADRYSGRSEPATRIIQAICKVIFLDMDLVIHCYLDDKDSSMRHILSRATDFRADMWTFSDDLNALATQIKATAESLSAEANGQPGSTSTTAGTQAQEVNKHVDKLLAQAEQLSHQTTQLDQRLKKLPLRDKLYLEDNTSKSGMFSRLVTMVLGKY
jgi:methyl-accepting chemotaxis protein